MRKILITIIALFTMFVAATTVNAQNKEIDSKTQNVKEHKDVKFWGIPFGTSKNKVKELMLSKKGTKEYLSGLDSNKNHLTFFNTPNFAGFNTSMVMCWFTNRDEFAKGAISLKPSSEQEIFSLYSSLKDLLIRKYGKPTSDYSFFKSPYENGDGFEITAIKSNKCMYAAFWTINEGDDAIEVSISILSSVEVAVMYNHKLLDKKMEDDNKNDAMSDI